MDGLSPRILAAIVAGRLAWSTPEELAYATGEPPEAIADVLADLDAAGWVSLWEDAPLGLAATLSPLAAERLRVRLANPSYGGHPRWIGPDETEPDPRERTVTIERPNQIPAVIDPGPKPTVLIGESLCPFPGPSMCGSPCKACGDAPRGSHYCIVCDRSGHDAPPRRTRAEKLARRREGTDGRKSARRLQARKERLRERLRDRY